MADKKITDLTELTALDGADLLEIVDVSDTSQAASGSSFKVALASLFVQEIKTVSSLPYTLILTDQTKRLKSTSATAGNIVLPLNSSVPWPVGQGCDVWQYAAGQITITGATGGVTIKKSGLTVKSRAQEALLRVDKTGTDEWLVTGDLAAS